MTMSEPANEHATSVQFLAGPLAIAMACIMVGAGIIVSWRTTGLYHLMAIGCVCVAGIQLGLTIYYRYRRHQRPFSVPAFEAVIFAFQGWFYIGVALLSALFMVFGNVVLGTIGLVVFGSFGCWAAHRGMVRLRRLHRAESRSRA